MTRSYEYYEVRPCIESKGNTESYTTLDGYEKALHIAATSGAAFETFWSLYGRVSEDGECLAECIGDYETQGAAMDVMNAILAPLAVIRDGLLERYGPSPEACVAKDIINQSSNSERI